MLTFFSLLCCVILLIMAREDWKTNAVSEWKCLISWMLVAVSWFYCGHNVLNGVILALLLVLYYLPFEISVFGDADIIPFAMFIAISCSEGLFSIYAIAYLIILLITLIPYGKFYAKVHDFKWKFGDRVMMPALPCFAFVWCVYTVLVGVFELELGDFNWLRY